MFDTESSESGVEPIENMSRDGSESEFEQKEKESVNESILTDVDDTKSEESGATSSDKSRGRKGTSFSDKLSFSSLSAKKSSTTNSEGRDSKTMKSRSQIKDTLEDMGDAELVNAVQELQKSVKHYELENMVFQHFLEKNDPTTLEEKQVGPKTPMDRRSSYSKRLTLTRRSTRQSMLLGSILSVSFDTPSAAEKEGPRINITQKMDLVVREMEELESALEKIRKKCYKARHKLKAELEEMNVREAELEECLETFDAAFIQGTSEKFTQKNPADRFARFMEENFRQNRKAIDKLRLRTSSLKVQYQKVCSQLAQKKSLGENLQEVDFEQLQIANKHLIETIEKRNLLLLELKKMNGKANLVLSQTKKNLLQKVESLNAIKETIKLREDLIVKLDEECDKVADELEQTRDEYDRIKMKSENYEVPAILDYVKTKAEMDVLKKNLKIWSRRKQIQDMDLNAALREMKLMTGLKKAKATWFIKPSESQEDSEIVPFEFQFEKNSTRRRSRNPRKYSHNI